MAKQLRDWNWRDSIENGEIEIQQIAQYYGMADNDILSFAKRNHGARLDETTDQYMMKIEDAEAIDFIDQDNARQVANMPSGR